MMMVNKNIYDTYWSKNTTTTTTTQIAIPNSAVKNQDQGLVGSIVLVFPRTLCCPWQQAAVGTAGSWVPDAAGTIE